MFKGTYRVVLQLNLNPGSLNSWPDPPSPGGKTRKCGQSHSEKGKRCRPVDMEVEGLASASKLPGRLLADACVGAGDHHYLPRKLYICPTNPTSEELPIGKGNKSIHEPSFSIPDRDTLNPSSLKGISFFRCQET